MAEVLSSEHSAVAAASGVDHGRVRPGALISLVARLRWTLWKRSFRKNVGKLIGTIFGTLYGAGGLVLLVVAMLGLTIWSGEGETFPLLMRGLGVATMLAWLLVPLLAFGVDDTPDPRAFAVHPRSARELQPALFVASTISLPAVFTVLAVGIATVFEVIWLLAYSPGGAGMVAALIVLVPANLVGVALCLLLPRAVFAHSASRTTSRSGRELGSIVAMVIGLGAVYGGSLLLQRIDEFDADVLLRWAQAAVSVLAWTPLGAAFAVPMDLAEGSPLVALVRILITAAAVVLVWLWWRRSLSLTLTSALSGDASSGAAKVTSLVPRFARADALGAVIGRSLRYWRRDTRYLAAVGVFPLIFVFFGAMGLVLPDSRAMMMGLLVFMTGVTGLSISNEVGFDGPSGWVNITSGVPARVNLLGRVIAASILLIPATLVLLAAVTLIFGYAQALPMILLGGLGLMLTGWGASLLMGVLLPYPTSPPGTNPMKDKSSSSSNAMLSMGASMLVLFIPQLPALGIAIWGLVVSSAVLQGVAGLLSVVIGVVMLWVCMRLAAVRLDRSYPELFQKVRAHL